MSSYLANLVTPNHRSFCAQYLVDHRGRPYRGRSVVLGNAACEEYDRRYSTLRSVLFWLENPVLWIRVRWALLTGRV